MVSRKSTTTDVFETQNEFDQLGAVAQENVSDRTEVENVALKPYDTKRLEPALEYLIRDSKRRPQSRSLSRTDDLP